MLTTKTTCGANSLFEAVRRLPDAALEVKVYGDTQPFPDYARRLRRMVGQDPRLSLAGVYGGMEVSQVLQGLDVVVVPSVWYENSSNTVLEAFAHRTPVIASDLGGMAELVHHGENGLLFTPGDASSLALQLRRLLDEPYLLPALRAGIGPVRGVAEEMSELEEIYQAVVRNSRLRSEEASR
jgi:glycosyltransferase involved in cell wall biosynthesis